jgi:small subunit ribosomal protein S16
MVLKIRLARFGKRHAPFYNIVVAHARYACNPPRASRTPTFLGLHHAPQSILKPHHRKSRDQKMETTNSNTIPSYRTARGSKPLEVLGTYDPIPKTPTDGNETAKKFKDIKLDIHRAKYWLGVGAQPSEPAWRLLSMVSLFPPADQKERLVEEERDTSMETGWFRG